MVVGSQVEICRGRGPCDTAAGALAGAMAAGPAKWLSISDVTHL